MLFDTLGMSAHHRHLHNDQLVHQFRDASPKSMEVRLTLGLMQVAVSVCLRHHCLDPARRRVCVSEAQPVRVPNPAVTEPVRGPQYAVQPCDDRHDSQAK